MTHYDFGGFSFFFDEFADIQQDLLINEKVDAYYYSMNLMIFFS